MELILAETVAPKGRINLGGRTLGDIVKGLEGLGWTTNENALKFMRLNTKIIRGNIRAGEFLHAQPNDIDGEHTDSLLYVGSSLVRSCPRDGQKSISSSSHPTYEVVQS